MKFLSFIIHLVFWLWLFLVPTGLLGFIAWYQYAKNPKNTVIPILILTAGICLGVFIAEFVRRKYGLDSFFGSIKASRDFDKFNEPDKK
jgi:hypothetical protein